MCIVRLIFLFLFFCCVLGSNAQQDRRFNRTSKERKEKIELLKHKVIGFKKEKLIDSLVHCYNFLSSNYRLENSPDTSKLYIDSSFFLLPQIKSKEIMYEAFEKKAYWFNSKSQRDSALVLIDSILKGVGTDKEYLKLRLRAESIKANCLIMKGDYAQANFYNFGILKEEQKDTGLINIETYNNIAAVYYYQGNIELSKQYYRQAVKMSKLNGDIEGGATACNNLAALYRTQEQYDSALMYLNDAYKVYEYYGFNNSMAINLASTGSVYAEMGDLEKSNEYFFKAYDMLKESSDISYLCYTLREIAYNYFETKNFPKAFEYAERSLKLSLEHKLKLETADSYYALYEFYNDLGKYKEALMYFKKSSEVQDSIFTEKNQKQINELETLYETEKHIKENEELQKKNQIAELEKKSQSNVLKFLLIVAVLLVVIIGVVYNRYRIKNKSQQIILRKNEELNTANAIILEKQKEIEDSINYAQRIQRSFLASEEDIKANTKENFVLFMPRDVVSGDFYWSVTHNDLFFLCVADSTGHGIPGAFMSLLNISLLNEAVLSKEFNRPSEILNFVRKILILGLKKDASGQGGNDGMDCSLICIDKKRGVLTYAGANNSLWLIRDGKLQEIDPDKMPVGRSPLEHLPFNDKEISFKEGDCIYLYTDGYADQFGGPKGKKLKYKPFKEVLIRSADKPMREQHNTIKQYFLEWKGDVEQIDDVCVAGIKL